MVGASLFRGRLMTDHFKKFSAETGSRATPRVDATREIAIAKLSISRCGTISIPLQARQSSTGSGAGNAACLATEARDGVVEAEPFIAAHCLTEYKLDTSPHLVPSLQQT